LAPPTALSSGNVCARLPSTVPSCGATETMYLAAAKLPAPGMFSVTIAGWPGKYFGKNSATRRP
jgi:hypothetical protein